MRAAVSLVWSTAAIVAVSIALLIAVRGVPDNPVHPTWPNVVRPSR